jgi:hypothetical protein|tara:strand:- start:65 stop:226 length:162 start_codon:yes stop_codon:yes gene_type:complete
MDKQTLNELDMKWINSIIDKRPESEIRINKIKYIKAMEEYAKKTKPKNPRKEP